MGTTTRRQTTATLLLGQVRSAILALLFFHTDEAFYLRQITRLTGAGLGNVQRELENLLKAGLIIQYRRGVERYYQANSTSPIYTEMHGLMVKTAGVTDTLRATLATIGDRIAIAFIYGSVARGTENAGSDVDVMVIGDVSFGDVVAALLPAQESLRREINPFVATPTEYAQRLSQHDFFLTAVVEQEKIFLIGDDDDLARLAAQ